MKDALGEYVPFACGSSCTINFVREKYTVRSRTVGLWKTYIQTEISGTIEIEGVVTLFNTGRVTSLDLMALQRGQGYVEIICSIFDRYGNEATFTCPLLLDEVGIGFTMGSTSSTTVKGTIQGEPTITYTGSNPAPAQTYVNPYCALEDEDGSYIRDVDGSLIADGDCPTVTYGEFAGADFSSLDFFV